MSGRLPERGAEDAACCAVDAPAPVVEDADFPPLFSARMALPGEDVRAAAKAAAVSGELGAADILWGFDGRDLEMVIVLEPDVAFARARRMRELMLKAVTDALASLLPPQVAITARGNEAVEINGGAAGSVFLDSQTGDEDAIPEWLNAGARLHMRRAAGIEGGDAPQTAVIAEEGGPHISPAALAASISRHFLLHLDDWR